MADRTNRDWTDRFPLYGRELGTSFLELRNIGDIYSYAYPVEAVDIAPLNAIEGNPAPAVEDIEGLPEWASQDGTHIKGTTPSDFDDIVEVSVIVQN